MTRYYKATDGTFTVFRATETKGFAFADLTARDGEVVALGFGNIKGALKAVEIDRREYQVLVRAKGHRIDARRAELEAQGKPVWGSLGSKPYDSWVRNADQLAWPVEDEPKPGPARLEEVINLPLKREAFSPAKDPTKTTYLSLVQAYDYLNAELWGGKLPTCLVTLQRKSNCKGYFAGGRFKTRDGKTFADEIALNPAHFAERDTAEIVSTLAHEMAHLEQMHFGKPAKGGYHNKEWGMMMHRIGLTPVSLDQPGKEVGNKVTHTVDKGGLFHVACEKLMRQGVVIDYIEAWTTEGQAKAKKKLASKTKYSCPACGQNAWAKPDANLICGACDEAMEAEEA